MGVKLMESKSCFGIHLDGDSEIDATLLANTISDMAELTKSLAKVENPEAYVKMNVTAFRNGSFQIDFSTICEVSTSILNIAQGSTAFALAVVGIIKGCFEIKKHLKGSAPKAVTNSGKDSVEVENADGTKICVPKSSATVINDIKIDQLVVNISNNVIEHNPKGGFSFNDEKGTAHYSAEDVRAIAKSLPIEQKELCQRIKIEADLAIKKVDFVGNTKWTFVYGKKSIDATIADDNFLKTVHIGAITIRNGDYITATLEKYVDLDILGNPKAGTEKYTVIQVHGGIKSFQQQTL